MIYKGVVIYSTISGGSAGNNKNKTASLQARSYGGIVLKIVRYTVGNRTSYDRAEKKIRDYIDRTRVMMSF